MTQGAGGTRGRSGEVSSAAGPARQLTAPAKKALNALIADGVPMAQALAQVRQRPDAFEEAESVEPPPPQPSAKPSAREPSVPPEILIPQLDGFLEAWEGVLRAEDLAEWRPRAEAAGLALETTFDDEELSELRLVQAGVTRLRRAYAGRRCLLRALYFPGGEPMYRREEDERGLELLDERLRRDGRVDHRVVTSWDGYDITDRKEVRAGVEVLRAARDPETDRLRVTLRDPESGRTIAEGEYEEPALVGRWIFPRPNGEAMSVLLREGSEYEAKDVRYESLLERAAEVARDHAEVEIRPRFGTPGGAAAAAAPAQVSAAMDGSQDPLKRARSAAAVARARDVELKALIPILEADAPLVRTVAAIELGKRFARACPPRLVEVLAEALRSHALREPFAAIDLGERRLITQVALALGFIGSGRGEAGGDTLAAARAQLPALSERMGETDANDADVYGGCLLALALGRGERPFAPGFLGALEAITASEAFFAFDANAEQTLGRWRLPGALTALRGLVAEVRAAEDPEAALHAFMHR